VRAGANADVETIALQPIEEKREVLYYAKRSWRRDLDATIARASANRYEGVHVNLTVKPEGKQEGRVVTLSDARARKVTSACNNNASSLLSSVPGSLLGVSERRKTAILDA
jgi:hypothetical protein